MSSEIPVDRDRLEADANALRARLADHLEILDQRIHDSVDIKRQAIRHPLTGVLIATGALLAGGAVVVAYRARQKELRHTQRWLLSEPDADGWRHPQPAPPPPGLAKDLAGRILISVAAYVLAQLAKRAMKKYVPQLGSPEHSQ